MRKYLIRWWYTEDWQAARTMQAIREWNEKEWPDSVRYAELNYDFIELWDKYAVALHRVRHRLPYTGSGDLFDP